MIKIINKNNNFEDFKKENLFYIGRGSVFGNYIYTLKPSQYDLPNMKNEDGLPLLKKDFDTKYLKSKEFKFFIDKIITKLNNNEDIILQCYCINKDIKDIKEINIKKAKCHGEILALKIFEVMENKLNIKPKENISNDLSI